MPPPLSFMFSGGSPVAGVTDTTGLDPQVAQVLELLGQLESEPVPRPPSPPPTLGTAQRILGNLGDAILAMAAVRAGGTPPPIGPFAFGQREQQERFLARQEAFNRQLSDAQAADRRLRNTLRIGALESARSQAGRIALQREQASTELQRAEQAHQDRLRQFDLAERNVMTTEARARLEERRQEETERHNRALEKLTEKRTQARGKPLDRQTRDLLNDAKTGSDFAKQALALFEEGGGTAGGPVAGRLPTFLLPESTQNFDTLRVKAEAQLRKYLAGSAVTPTELTALTPLLVQLSGTPNQIRQSLRGISDFFDAKRRTLLRTLEQTGVDPEIAEQVRAEFGESGISSMEAPGGSKGAPTETESEKIQRLRKEMGL